MTSTMIDRKQSSVAELFGGIRYTLREKAPFDWEASDVLLKVGILLGAFQASYRPEHSISAAENYPGIRLGEIMTMVNKDVPKNRVVLHGHQLLTTLVVVLTCLQSSQKNGYDSQIEDDETWYYGGRRWSYPDGDFLATLESLYIDDSDDEDPELSTQACRNFFMQRVETRIALRETLDDRAVPHFAHWLLHNVHLDEFMAHTEEGARLLHKGRDELIHE